MFKLMLIITVVGSCGTLGLIKSMNCSRRLKQLNGILDSLIILHTEISYLKDPLPVIFKRLSSQKNDLSADILYKCSTYMSENQPLDRCWQQAVREACSNSSLNTADKAVICDLGASLGKSGISGQKQVLGLAQEKIMHQIRDAEDEKKSKGKMYGGLGFSIGLVIAVLFI